MMRVDSPDDIQYDNTLPAYTKGCYYEEAPESVYFYTFHKCASSLFGGYILKNVKGLQHVDYEAQIYNGLVDYQKLDFRSRGFIYGPIRISNSDPTSTVNKLLIAPTSEHKFIRDKISIFFVRDPRDILVSSYYSFGYSHDFSPVKRIREQQEIQREKILAQSLDEYVLGYADGMSKNFTTLYELFCVCERSVILKYEDLINNYEYLIDHLVKYIVMEKDIVQEIYKRSRPKQQEDLGSHRRSGQVGCFRDKLSEKNLLSLNSKLEAVLQVFEYEF
jgi:hypothetical protein